MKHTCYKNYLFSIVFLLIFTTSFAQNETTDVNQLFGKLYSQMYTNKDSAYYYTDKIINVSNKYSNYEYMLYALLFSNKSATYFNDYNIVKSNLNKIDSLFLNYKTNIDTIASIHTIKISRLFDKSTYAFKLNDYETAQNYLSNLLSESKKVPNIALTKQDTDLIYAAYVTKAKMYSNDEKFSLAEEYYKKSIRFLNNLNDIDKPLKISNVYRLIGELHKRQGHYKTSNNFITKAFNYSLKNSKNENSLINEANNIIENYISLKQLDSAAYYLKYIEPYKDSNMPYGFMFYKARAKLNIANNNYETVTEDFSKAITLLKKKWKGYKHPEIGKTYSDMSNYYLFKNNIPEALFQNQLAIQQVHGDSVISSSINNSEYLKLLKEKILIENKTNNHLNVSKTAAIALTVLDSLKPSFKDNIDKLLLVDNAFPIFENYLNALYHLNKNSDNNNYSKQAFNIIEKSKSTLLLEALLSAKATNYANIPETITEKEQLYKTEITRLEKSLERTQNETIEEQLFKQKNEYHNFIKNLEINYKSYYNLKYNTQVATIESIQKLLDKDDRLISYFYGESSLFILNATNNKISFSKIDIDDNLNNLIKEVYTLLGNPKSDLQLLNSKSYELFSITLAPSLKGDIKKNLIILPDGLLNYIPFSALITNESSYNYLVEDYAISYANSATLLLQLQEKKQNNKSALAFAPSFNDSNLLELPNNKKEAQNVLSYFSGELYSNDNATLENFYANNSKYSVLHLATHAIYDDKTPEYSYLAFTNEDNKEHSLYVRDLYNLELNADLVTLSACESGIGKLNRGEGLMSLARGFYFSGVNSISSTLWKVNDASSTKLMDTFYKALSEKKNKNEAIKEAQLNFLNKNRQNKLSHPYYWSGFIVSGNTNPINKSSYMMLFVICGIIILLLLYLYLRKRAFSAKLSI